jgi:hypothetical protein
LFGQEFLQRYRVGGAFKRKKDTMTAKANSPFASLRLSQNFGQGLGVVKVLTAVPVGKPTQERFFRTRESSEWVYPAWVLESKTSRETYIVSEQVASVLGPLVRAVELYTAIDRQNNVFLIPVPLPGPNGVRNSWHESLLQAVMRAKLDWLRITSNHALGGYDIFQAITKLPEPIWPDLLLMEDLLGIAFRERIITDPEHPVVQELLGAV